MFQASEDLTRFLTRFLTRRKYQPVLLQRRLDGPDAIATVFQRESQVNEHLTRFLTGAPGGVFIN